MQTYSKAYLDEAQAFVCTMDARELIEKILLEYLKKAYAGLHKIICFHNLDEENGLLAKFLQNEEIANRFDMKKWNGQNLLGFALMQVRERGKYDT